MIFPSLTLETVLQVDDKTRINAYKSFATNGETITDVEIKPEATGVFISVFNADSDKWYLDWAYDVDGLKDVEIRVTSDAPDTRTKIYSITVLTEVEDNLFSFDNDLYPYEPNINQYLPRGKASYIYAHRAAQTKILAFLDEQRIWKNDSTRFSKEDILDIEEFRNWSLFQTLLIIFEGSQVSNKDIFQEKRIEYEKDMIRARNRASLRLDADGDGENDPLPYNVRTTTLKRR